MLHTVYEPYHMHHNYESETRSDVPDLLLGHQLPDFDKTWRVYS